MSSFVRPGRVGITLAMAGAWLLAFAPGPAAAGRTEDKAALERLEIELMRLEGELRGAAVRVREREGRLAELEASLEEAESRLEEREARMAGRLRAMYRLRHRGFLPLLFSAESPHDLLRNARYLWWIVQEDRRSMEEWSERQVEADVLRQQVEEERAELLQWAGEASLRQQEAMQDRDERQSRLGHVRDPVDRRRMSTVVLEEPADEMDVRLDLRSEEPPTELAVETVVTTSMFERSRGKLPMPVVGRVSAAGNGVDIRATVGTPIRAVHTGHVTKVTQVDGFGLICIVNHGDDWHSVYGYAAGFDVRPGQKVDGGDVLGTVGEPPSGSSRLHFSIRRGRSPEDPLEWMAIPPGVAVQR